MFTWTYTLAVLWIILRKWKLQSLNWYLLMVEPQDVINTIQFVRWAEFDARAYCFYNSSWIGAMYPNAGPLYTWALNMSNVICISVISYHFYMWVDVIQNSCRDLTESRDHSTVSYSLAKITSEVHATHQLCKLMGRDTSPIVNLIDMSMLQPDYRLPIIV